MSDSVALDVAGLFEADGAALLRYFQRRLTSDDLHMAEDLTSATFERAIGRAERYVDRGKPASWLYTIAHHLLIDYVRRRKTTSELDVAEWRTVVDAGADHHTAALDVDRTLGHLLPAHRAVLTARFLHGQDVRQTAAALGRSEEAIKKLQGRALVRARRILESPVQIATVEAPRPTPPDPSPLQTVMLPTIAEAVAWAASTGALRTALEREEREALAAYEAAKERLLAARRAAGAVRKMQELLKIGGTAAPERRSAVAALPSRAGGRWSRDHERCIDCSRTTIKHAGQGRCRTCYRRHGTRAAS